MKSAVVNSQRSQNLDFLKLFCSFLVVLFHCKPVYREWTQAIANSAVPCFFMISGFFLYSEKLSERCLRSIKKTAIIISWSTLFYLPLFLYGIMLSNVETPTFGELLIKFVLFNDNPIGVHLWYLSAYIYVLAIVYFLNKRESLDILFYITPLLWIFDMIGGWGGQKTIYLRNFLIEGLPCFSVGMFVRRYSIKDYFNIEVLLLGIFTLCAGCIVETHLYESTHQTVSTSLLAIPLLLFFLKLPQNYFDKIMSKVDPNDSLYIYIFHPAVIILFSQFNKILPYSWSNHIYPIVSPMVVFVTTYLLIVSSRFILLLIKPFLAFRKK